jgi:stearoyl-CoA desaturase (delta-9 desaturase)
MTLLLDFQKYLTTISKSFYFQFLPAIILGTTTIALLVTGVIPLYYLVYTFIMWVLVCGLGLAVGYHRVFAHKTHQLPRWKENIIMFLATFAGQGASIFWVSLHRGYHHRLSDREGDVHSPVVYGVYHAFVGWQQDITESNNTISMKYAVDLLRKSNHIWFHKHHIKILWGVPLIVAIFDWQLALTAFWLVTMIGVLQDNLINVVGHKKCVIGYRNFDTDDNSHNNVIMGYLGWGQGWHNNHHHSASSYDFGRSVRGRWWEWDPCKIFLPLLK